MKHYSIILAVLFPLAANSAILVEENGQEVVYTQNKVASDSKGLRELRRVGIGAAAAGQHGIFGLNVELNLTNSLSPEIGFGLSSEFQTFHLQLKRYLGGEMLTPYVVAGYAHWSNNGEKSGGINDTNPGFVAEQFMSEEDKKKGRISAHILYPAAGIQYVVLNGPWAGLGIHAEVDLLLEVESLEAVATGSIGGIFYF